MSYYFDGVADGFTGMPRPRLYREENYLYGYLVGKLQRRYGRYAHNMITMRIRDCINPRITGV